MIIIIIIKVKVNFELNMKDQSWIRDRSRASALDGVGDQSHIPASLPQG
jgi:hypothetical protein